MSNFKADAATMNALISALGALTMATVRRLPPDQQQAFAADLAQMASAAEKRGDVLLETLLIDMYRAVKDAP